MTRLSLPLITILAIALAACASPDGPPGQPIGSPESDRPIELPIEQPMRPDPWADDPKGDPDDDSSGPPRFDDLTFEVSDITVRVQPQPISKIIKRPDFPAKLFAYRDYHSIRPKTLQGPPIRWPVEDVQVSGNRVTFRAVRPGSVYVVVSWEGVDLEAPMGSVADFKITVTAP